VENRFVLSVEILFSGFMTVHGFYKVLVV